MNHYNNVPKAHNFEAKRFFLAIRSKERMNFDWVKMWCLKYQCMASFFFFSLREVFLWIGIDDIIVAFGRFRESLCIISIKVCKFCFKELHIELPLYQSKLYRILVLSIFLDQPRLTLNPSNLISRLLFKTSWIN